MKKISKNRVITELHGFKLILPENFKNGIPLFCPVCERILMSQEDIDSFKEMSCCENCDTYWARKNI